MDNEIRNESTSFIATRWKNDNGIDFDVGVIDFYRPDENRGNLPWALDIITKLGFALSCPATFCCAFTQVKLGEDVIVSRCGYVTNVLRTPGFHLVNPCCLGLESIDMKLRDTEILKMSANDNGGIPLVVSAQFIWRISDSLTSRFSTSNLEKFLKDQGASTLRHVLATYPYDQEEEKSGACLRKHSEELDNHLKNILQRMVEKVGVKIEQFSLMNISIEQSMEKLLLVKQEAKAELIARKTISEGASGIVGGLIEGLNSLGITFSQEEINELARDLTLILVNRGGHTNLTLIQGHEVSSSKGKEKKL